MKKKILIVYKFLPEYRVDFYQQLRNKLLKENIELSLIYGKFNKIDALRKNEVEIDWAQYIPNRRFHLGKFEFLWQPVTAYLKDKDLIIAQQESKLLLNYYIMLTKHFSKYKFAFWGHVNNMQNNPDSFGNKFKLFFINKCDWWFGYTISAKKYLINHGFPENKITIVQNAIDTLVLKKHYSEISVVELDQLKRRLNISGDHIGIYCGAMYPEKDFEFILAACNMIRQKLPDFQMIFVGSGIESTKIKNAAASYDWIHDIGPKFGQERIIYFKISSVQIMPRLVGLCILDSFAMETPIVTTDHPYHGPEIDYLENGINGIMTRDNLNDYAEAIVEILTGKRYLDLIEGGKKSAEKYTVENMVENFKNGILSCINGL